MGGPPWPPLCGIDRIRQTERRRLLESGEFHAGAATEGRPYSTFDEAQFFNRLGR